MKFKLSDFLQLDTKSLFAVNGGSDCSGSSSSYVSFESSSGGNESSGDGGYGGGGSSVTTIYSSHSNSNAASSAGGSCSSFLKNSDGTYKTDFTSTATTKNPVTQPSNPENTSPSVGGLCSGSGGGTKESKENSISLEASDISDTKVLEDSVNENLVISRNDIILDIKESIDNNIGKKYNENGNGYKCDNCVEQVIDDAGYDSSKYLSAGDSSNTVKEHIDALTNSVDEYTTSVPTKNGVYVVFMGDGTFSNGNHADEHCALYVVENGCGKVWDNSSGNLLNESGGNIASSNIDEYTPYKSFYFQEITK